MSKEITSTMHGRTILVGVDSSQRQRRGSFYLSFMISITIQLLSLPLVVIGFGSMLPVTVQAFTISHSLSVIRHSTITNNNNNNNVKPQSIAFLHEQKFRKTTPYGSILATKTCSSSISSRSSSVMVLQQAISSEDDEFDDLNDTQRNNDNNSDNELLLEQLRTRMNEIKLQEFERMNRMKKADQCISSIVAVLPDWVRRLDVTSSTTTTSTNTNSNLLAVCGSASDTIFVLNLQTGQILASNQKYILNKKQKQQQREKKKIDNDNDNNDDDDDSINLGTIRLLYGQYDGGGTISIGIHGNNNNLIAVGVRTGGVQIWRYDNKSPDLIYQGNIPNLNNIIATSIQFDKNDNYVWISTDDGYVYVYSVDEADDKSLPLVLQTKPDYGWNLQSAVLSLSLCPELSCAVATTASGFVHLLSLDDYEYDDVDNIKDIKNNILPASRSYTPPYDSTERRSTHAYALCATIVASTATKSYSIACGANNGSIYIQPIRMIQNNSENNKDKYNNMSAISNIFFKNNNSENSSKVTSSMPAEIDWDRPFQGMKIQRLLPSHYGPVKCMASTGSSGLLLTAGSMDGSLRVWDVTSQRQLYQFLGYKVWIGSIWTDGVKIISDGADNTIIQHDFTFNNISDSNPTNKNKKSGDDTNEQ